MIAPIKADAGAPPSTHGSSFGAHAIVSIGDAVVDAAKRTGIAPASSRHTGNDSVFVPGGAGSVEAEPQTDTKYVAPPSVSNAPTWTSCPGRSTKRNGTTSPGPTPITVASVAALLLEAGAKSVTLDPAGTPSFTVPSAPVLATRAVPSGR